MDQPRTQEDACGERVSPAENALATLRQAVQRQCTTEQSGGQYRQQESELEADQRGSPAAKRCKVTRGLMASARRATPGGAPPGPQVGIEAARLDTIARPKTASVSTSRVANGQLMAGTGGGALAASRFTASEGSKLKVSDERDSAKAFTPPAVAAELTTR